MEMNSDTCKFNVNISCYPHDKCGRCGWNPEVAARRKARIVNLSPGGARVLTTDNRELFFSRAKIEKKLGL